MKMNHTFESQLHYWTHMLDEALLTEGKHWPEDYKKTAFSTIKASDLGKQSWYTNSFIRQDIDTIASDFMPLAHRNSNLGYFAAVIRWFCQYAGTDRTRYQEFIERKLDNVIQYLQLFVNDEQLVEKYRDDVKQKFSYEQFIGMMKPIAYKAQQDANSTEFEVVNKGYEIIPIMSYEELHSKFGGPVTGYNGQSEWCHTNGKSTYDSWTSNYTRFFFVLAKKNWEKILPPDPETTNAYDEYGTSLMAILVSDKGELLNCTLRWNHVIDPAAAKPGRTVDKAFISFAELSQVTGLDVEAEVKKELSALLEKTTDFPRGWKVYEGPEGLCFASDRLQWYDKDLRKINPPEEVSGNFNCSGNKITSLEGCPREVGGRFDCSGNKITSLKGCPEKVGGIFDCSRTNITFLEGCPREVKGSFYCLYTKITSLEGCPREVGGRFDCSNTNITSLKGAPAKIRLIGFSKFPNSISTQKLNAYKKWLKTNPEENYPG